MVLVSAFSRKFPYIKNVGAILFDNIFEQSIDLVHALLNVTYKDG